MSANYIERMYFSVKLWLFLLALSLTFYIAVWAALDVVPAVIATILLLLALSLLNMRSATIRIENQKLHVGFATIELAYLGTITLIEDFAKYSKSNRPIDPAGFLQIKFWIKSAVKIELTDKSDPTPFWIISSRRAEDLSSLLLKLKTN